MPRRRRLRRTWPQRLVLALSVAMAMACLAAAGVVWYGNDRLGSLERVSIAHAAPVITVLELSPSAQPAPTSSTDVPVTTVAPFDGRAQNFLLVGSDSRDCIDPASPYAGAFLNDEFAGNRSDTIMVLRVDPDANRAAIVSFPRDLWVEIAGTNRRGRINSAFDAENPSTLVQTIEQEFAIPIDHYVEVDFCAFKDLVDAVGGIKVPFAYPARDANTGLDVPAAGCVTFDGESALAYVRSRHYEWFDGKRWRADESSDYGRIKRQQEFIRRALQRAIDRGARRPAVAKNLIDSALEHVRVDRDLTLADLVGLASRLRDFDPGTVRTFRIDGTPTVIGGAQVILPDTTSRTAKRLLRVFRGEALLADLPDETAAAATTATAGTSTSAAGEASSGVRTASTTTLPTVQLADAVDGIFPPVDPTCR